jgi:hypothetical protein
MAIIMYHPSAFDGTLTILGTDYAVEGGVTTINDAAAYQAHAFQCGFKTTPQTAAQLAASYGSTGPTRAGSVIFDNATSMPIVFSTPFDSADYQVLASAGDDGTGFWVTSLAVNGCTLNCADPISATVTYIAIVDAS